MRFPRDEPNTPGPSRGIDQPVDQPPRWVGGPVVHLDSVSAAIATGKRPAPFRTRKLSPSAPMVLPGGPGGRVGRRRTSLTWVAVIPPARTPRPERTTATQHFATPTQPTRRQRRRQRPGDDAIDTANRSRIRSNDAARGRMTRAGVRRHVRRRTEGVLRGAWNVQRSVAGRRVGLLTRAGQRRRSPYHR